MGRPTRPQSEIHTHNPGKGCSPVCSNFEQAARFMEKALLAKVALTILWLLIPANACLAAALKGKTAESAPVLRPVDPKFDTNLFVWSDTCNVFVIRDQDAALLIDLGDGSVLDHLSEIGVRRVEWVLFTHHHREQCQGAARLRGTGAKVAAPEAERALFERPADFRKMDVSLGDAFTIHGSSYVRPPIQSIALDRTFKTNDTFAWHGHEFHCVSTPGNSPGGMTYLLNRHEGRSAFSGDVMLENAKMHTWFDTEWDYGFAAGIRALRQSVTNLIALKPTELLPSHGPIVLQPRPQLDAYQAKLERLERLYVRGYDVEGGSVAYQDKVSTPTVVPDVVQISPHLFKFKRPNFWPNFGLILADSGRALVVDCGLLDETFLDTALEGMREHFGLKAIDAVIITHMHGDHFLEAPHLRERWGAKIWALDNMVDKMEHPEWFDYSAPIQAYGKKASDGSRVKGVRADRALRPGQTFTWEGYRFTVNWMPGQTEFALCLHGRIDGRKVAFTGDNIFGDPDDPAQTGHEAMVAHNSAILEEGYIYGAEYLKRLKPDILIGGHSFVMDHPAAFIERYRKWSYEMRAAFQALSPDPDYRYWFDPFWVRAQPYRVAMQPGQTETVTIHVRNFRSRTQAHRIEIHTPPGVVAEPSVLEGKLSVGCRRAFPIRIRAVANAPSGVRIVALDVTLDGQRYGERFDFVLGVASSKPGQQ
jgi:glyoxylase-like metal-dependent hydrolase (beta-lactamase superfamily II)